MSNFTKCYRLVLLSFFHRSQSLSSTVVWLGHNGVTRKLLTRATAGDTLLQNAVTGVAVPFRMLVHTTLTAAFYVGRTTAAVKAAFAQ